MVILSEDNFVAQLEQKCMVWFFGTSLINSRIFNFHKVWRMRSPKNENSVKWNEWNSLLILTLMESRGKFHSPQKHFWSFTTKTCCSILLNEWRRWGLVLRTTKLHSIFHQHDSWVKQLNFHFEWIYPLNCKQMTNWKQINLGVWN